MITIFDHLHAFWDDLWPNVVAPSLWTLLGITVSHAAQARQRKRDHQDLKKHVTKTLGGSG